MPSLNFAAFADVAPQVEHYGRLAEQALHRDPEVAVWRVRQVIESLVAWQEHLAGIDPGRSTLFQRMEVLRTRTDRFGAVEVLPRTLAVEALHGIRQQTNGIVHVGRFSRRAGGMSDASLTAVRTLERVTVVGHRFLGRVARFRVPLRPGVSEEVTSLAEELLFIESLIVVDRDFETAMRRLDAVEPRVDSLRAGEGCPAPRLLELRLGCIAQRQRLANNDGRLEVGSVPAELRAEARARGSGTAREILVEIQNRGALQLVKLGRLDDAEQRMLELMELLESQAGDSENPMDAAPSLISGKLAGKILGTAGLVELHAAHEAWDALRARKSVHLFQESAELFHDEGDRYRAQVYELGALVETMRLGGTISDEEQERLHAFVMGIDPARILPSHPDADTYAFSVALALKVARELKMTVPWISHLVQVLCERDTGSGTPLRKAPYPQIVGGALLAVDRSSWPTRVMAALKDASSQPTLVGWVAHRYRRALGLSDDMAVPSERSDWYARLPAHVRAQNAPPLLAVPGVWL